MLKWIGGAKVDHPMADLKQARAIVADLPAGDPGKAIDEIIQWLESLVRTEGFKVDRLFENIDLLDGAAKNHQRKLTQDYLAMERQQKFREHRLWSGVYGFWKALADAYLHCVALYEHAGGGTSFRKNLPVITARALRALALQLKWVLLRYGPTEPRVWSELARLYQFAEAGGFAESRIAIYPGAGDGSAKQEFLKAMMLAASSTDSLTPVRQEIAERAVAYFSGAFRLDRAPSEICNYAFDLSTSLSPARVIQGASPAPTVRYFGAGEALAQLERAMATVIDTGALPRDVNLGGTYHKDLIVGVFRHLATYWSDKPPARGSERRKTALRITVVPGFSGIMETLEPADSDALDFSEDRIVESWIVENVSDGGYGAIVPAKKSDWVKVGGMIGVQSEMDRYWRIGFVRRVTRDEHQQRRVGIQLVSKTVLPVRLSLPATVSSFNADREPEPAILLSTSPDASGEVGVIMRAGIYNARDSLDMTVKNRSYLLLPSKMMEGGEDYDWAKFKVMQRSD
ncbi:MAG: hypothetical protein KIT18_06745 [Burkholderiales bacterium]|nr:hypothetical protein [Burkholderiales bacterium]